MAENKPLRVAALYDIHGNHPALEAALKAVEAAKVDLILVGGDIISGPMPRQTLERLMAFDRPLSCIRGNADREVVAAFDAQDLSHLPAPIRAITSWTAQQIDRRQRDFLANLPPTMVINVQSLGEVLFCHAAPFNDTVIFTRETPEEYIHPLLANVPQSLIVCGHTHMQYVRQIGAQRLVNAGSVGMPYGAPGVGWALRGPKIQFMHTQYDLERAAARIRATDYPMAEDFAQTNVLQPATKEEAIEVFERQAAEQRRQH